MTVVPSGSSATITPAASSMRMFGRTGSMTALAGGGEDGGDRRSNSSSEASVAMVGGSQLAFPALRLFQASPTATHGRDDSDVTFAGSAPAGSAPTKNRVS